MIEHKFWKDGFDRIMPGYRDFDFTQKLIEFIGDIDLASLNDEEK